MITLRRIAMWLVMRGPRMPTPIAAWLFGFAIGSTGIFVKGPDQGDRHD